MSSSLEEEHGVPVNAQGSTVQVEFDEATTLRDISSVDPVCPSLPVSYGRPLFCEVSDACFSNYHSVISMLNTEDEKLLTDDLCQNSELQIEELGLGLHDPEYFGKIKELQVYLDTVKMIVRPGCSQELLNVALTSMSSLARILSLMSSKAKL